jgi:hypothetical protein
MVVLFARSALAVDAPAAARTGDAQKTSAIIAGFVGGFVRPDDRRHGEVPMVERLRAEYGARVRIQLYANRDVEAAHRAIRHWLAEANSGPSPHPVPIILFGNSWGASATVSLARELQAEGVPVLLTIQVDSVPRHFENDSVIPANVAAAVNFYQTRGLLHGRRSITAADPTRTRILGNFPVEHSRLPAACQDYPWYNRFFTPGHIAIDCDPQLWERVAGLIREHLDAVLAGR